MKLLVQLLFLLLSRRKYKIIGTELMVDMDMVDRVDMDMAEIWTQLSQKGTSGSAL